MSLFTSNSKRRSYSLLMIDFEKSQKNDFILDRIATFATLDGHRNFLKLFSFFNRMRTSRAFKKCIIYLARVSYGAIKH